MQPGEMVCAKTIEDRYVVEVKEGKNGKRRVIANRIGYRFQSEHNLQSTVGVFMYLGTFPEVEDREKVFKWSQSQLRKLGLLPEEPQAVDAVDPVEPEGRSSHE